MASGRELSPWWEGAQVDPRTVRRSHGRTYAGAPAGADELTCTESEAAALKALRTATEPFKSRLCSTLARRSRANIAG